MEITLYIHLYKQRFPEGDYETPITILNVRSTGFYVSLIANNESEQFLTQNGRKKL